MKQSVLLLLVIATLFFSGTTTHAVSISIDNGPGSFGMIPGGEANELLSLIYGTETRYGYYGSTVFLTEPSHVTFTFLGFEAGYDNDFNLAGFGELFSTEDFSSTTSPNNVSGISVQQGPFHLATGIIPFSFDINNDSGTVVNGIGLNPNDAQGTADINFFVSFDHDPSATTGTSLVLFLDDSGAHNDDDHDDFAIRIHAIPNPEPSTMLLFGAGLIGLAGFRRKFKKS
jgi:hypothetical protein